MSLEIAMKAARPIIGVTTDDLVNIVQVLGEICEKKPVAYKPTTKKPVEGGALLYTTDAAYEPTLEEYHHFRQHDQTLIIVNGQTNLFVHDAGTLPTPKSLMMEYLKECIGEEAITPGMIQTLTGLSLKTIDDVMMLTQARTGSVTVKELRYTRTQLQGDIQGLTCLDTTMEFYQYPEPLQEWLTLNTYYFQNLSTPSVLVPRGVLLDGPAGTGKSMGARAIANTLQVPLYRLDIASSMNKYIGASEERISKSLALLDSESPCVVLLDEIEKIFTGGSDNGVTNRILSQLLWWLAEHKSRVVVVMTTNDINKLPPELYRQGRIDRVIKIPRLSIKDAKTFAMKVHNSVLPEGIKPKHIGILNAAIEGHGTPDYSHSEVAELVYSTIKKNSWLKD